MRVPGETRCFFFLSIRCINENNDGGGGDRYIVCIWVSENGKFEIVSGIAADTVDDEDDGFQNKFKIEKGVFISNGF